MKMKNDITDSWEWEYDDEGNVIKTKETHLETSTHKTIGKETPTEIETNNMGENGVILYKNKQYPKTSIRGMMIYYYRKIRHQFDKWWWKIGDWEYGFNLRWYCFYRVWKKVGEMFGCIERLGNIEQITKKVEKSFTENIKNMIEKP